MNTDAPLHRPPHARIDHDAIHRADLRIVASRSPRPRRRARRRTLPTSTLRFGP